MHDKAQEVVATRSFQKGYKILGILFIILTYFIAVSPDSFVQFGYFGIFLFNTISSGLVIMPILVDKFPLPAIVFFSALGNIPNTSVNYFIGASSNTLFSGNAIVKKLKAFMDRFGLFAVYALSIIPFPIDINGLLSGYLGVSYKKYILVNFLGKVTVYALAGLGVLTFTQAMEK